MIKTMLIPMILFAVISKLPAQNESILRDEIRRLDMAHAKAIFQADAAALDTLMDDEVTVNHPTK